jgi:hypothetical protein
MDPLLIKLDACDRVVLARNPVIKMGDRPSRNIAKFGVVVDEGVGDPPGTIRR